MTVKKEDSNCRSLAFRIIDDATYVTSSGPKRLNTTARWVIKYVFRCVWQGMKVVRPSTEYLAKKYNAETGCNCSTRAMRQAISYAKKSGLIQTQGFGKTRMFFFNFEALEQQCDLRTFENSAEEKPENRAKKLRANMTGLAEKYRQKE